MRYEHGPANGWVGGAFLGVLQAGHICTVCGISEADYLVGAVALRSVEGLL